jgi:hypothetical protein
MDLGATGGGTRRRDAWTDAHAVVGGTCHEDPVRQRGTDPVDTGGVTDHVLRQ